VTARDWPCCAANQAVPDCGAAQGTLLVKNTGTVTIYPRLIVSGKPLPGTETAAANGLALDVKYFSLKTEPGLVSGVEPLNPAELPQGANFMAEVTATHTGVTGEYKELALAHLFPSGWEIHNERLDPGQQGAESNFEYQDIRDDRVYTYFSLKQGEAKTFKTLLNASYRGKFYLPMVSIEAMYDATINARLPGQWVQVVK
jgi:alpha-2-macroglobulin